MGSVRDRALWRAVCSVVRQVMLTWASGRGHEPPKARCEGLEGRTLLSVTSVSMARVGDAVENSPATFSLAASSDSGDVIIYIDWGDRSEGGVVNGNSA